jgi:hypothetical protein
MTLKDRVYARRATNYCDVPEKDPFQTYIITGKALLKNIMHRLFLLV